MGLRACERAQGCETETQYVLERGGRWAACRRTPPCSSFRLLAAAATTAEHLDDHLGDTLTAEGLGADKVLALGGGEGVADGGQRQEDGGGDQRAATAEDAEVLDDGHDGVGGGAHPVGGDAADEAIELGRGRADAEQEGDLNEEDDEGGCTVAEREIVSVAAVVVGGPGLSRRDDTTGGEGEVPWGRCLHGQGAEDDEQNGKGKDGSDSSGEADDHRQDAEPGSE